MSREEALQILIEEIKLNRVEIELLTYANVTMIFVLIMILVIGLYLERKK